MGSRKKSARARQRATFEAELGQGSRGLEDAFAQASAQHDRMAADHEAHLRHKACERKKRYASETDAKEAIRACERHGSRDLHCYRCPYCNGWHLTHKA